MVTVPIEDFRARLNDHLKDVQNGEGLVITEDGRAIARIVPVSDDETLPEGLRKMIAEGRVSWSGRMPTFPNTGIRLRGPGPTLSDIVIEGRG